MSEGAVGSTSGLVPVASVSHSAPRHRRAWRRLRGNPLALGALVFLVLVGLAVILAPLLTPYDYSTTVGKPYLPPSGKHWLGTDSLGRDEFTRLLYGGRTSLTISLCVVALVVIVAVPLGIIPGYKGGRADYFIIRGADTLSSFPGLILLIAIAGILGPSVRNTIIALSIVLLPQLARITRGQARAVGAETFVEASKAIGTKDRRIMRRRVLPSVASPVIVQGTVLLGGALLAEAGLSYLGLGARLPLPSWGNMLREGYDTSLFSEPRLVLFPGLAIALTVLAFNTLGDGLRDAFGLANQGPKGRSQRRGITTVVGEGRRSARKGGAQDTAAAVEVATVPTREPALQPNDDAPAPLLSIDGLRIEFDTPNGSVAVVDGLDLTIRHGEVLGLVGESGCGKSVTSLAVMRLLPSPPGRITGGRVMFDGTDLLQLSLRQLRHVRGAEISMIFQDSMTSLDPAFTVGHHLVEAQKNHGRPGRAAARKKALELLDLVGIADAPRRLSQFPHELSGGMRQRVMIAMALANEPQLLIADEPTTALDVTIQAQILDLLRDLQSELHMAMLFVTHDLGVIAEIADRVAVMYAGQVVEQTSVHDLFKGPRHPYTKGLLGAMPSALAPAAERLTIIPGAVPMAHQYPTGCRFQPRCSRAVAECASAPIELVEIPTGSVRCIRPVAPEEDAEHAEARDAPPLSPVTR